MKAYPLPEFLNGNEPCDVYIHHYRSEHDYLKNKIKLNKNLICILLNGTKEVFGSHTSIKIDNSEMLLISSGNVLMWESIAAGNKLESLLLFFSNEFLNEFAGKYKLDYADQSGMQGFLSVAKDSYIYTFQQSIKSLSTKDLQSMQCVKVEELLVYLASKNPSDAFKSFIKNAQKVNHHSKLKDVVAANLTKGLTIEELAFLCNMSTSTFKRHFEKTFKCSPRKYFTDQRMIRARDLILLDKRPSEIYTELRYQNLSSFSTEFKKYFGVSPRLFKKSSLVVN